MEKCSLLGGCIFFNDKMAHMPAATDLLKKRYCNDCFKDCARFKVASALGRDNVPADLYPDEIARAEKSISKKGE